MSDTDKKTPIQGFQLLVTSDELEVHFRKRLFHHETALATLDGNKIKLIGVKGDESQIVGKHKEQIRLLKYIVAHLPLGDTFRLSLHELGGLMVLDSLVDTE